MALHPHRYLDLLDADARRMAALAPGHLALPVPPCPGWNVAEVMRHTASVYGNKVASIRLGRPASEGEWRTHPPQGVDVVHWFSQTFGSLREELIDHDPGDPTPTWWPPDQTVGFWYRRMALETVVHRVDVEIAVGKVSDVHADLAGDGIDEVLTVFLGMHDPGAEGAPSGVVGVAANERSWTLHLEEDAVRVEPGDVAPATAHVSGEPAQVFLYLWGRASLNRLKFGGDPGLIAQLRRRLAAATQ
ncbi:MAG TPA: maleylpyruvate isomerase family mycothiol-dependent enzyme [Candidatus Dormibacteraeota bacterium]